MYSPTQGPPNSATWYKDWAEAEYKDHPTLADLLKLASKNEALKALLVRAPLETALEYGVGINTTSIKKWLGEDPRAVTDGQLLDMLIRRLENRRLPQCSG